MTTHNLRSLKQQLGQEGDPGTRQRLWVVALLEEKSMSWSRIYAWTGVPRSTAYSHLSQFRKHGVQGLLRLKRPGRPSTIPQIVRERFEYLCRHDPSTTHNKVVYVIDRERAVYRILKNRFSSRQLTRWYRQLSQEHHLGKRFMIFRRMRPAYPYLREGEIARLGVWCPKTPRDFQRLVRLDALHYVADRNPHDRELLRKVISATHRTPLSKIAFGDEPHFRTAEVALSAIPEELEPVDIFAPQPSSAEASMGSIDRSLENF